uniref:Uncharacterized protein n=1 Tax=Oryza nivara TaxID=4536 RepID=A0A0E0HPM5_ORYNI
MALKNFLVLGVFLAALLMFSLDDVAHARELTEANESEGKNGLRIKSGEVDTTPVEDMDMVVGTVEDMVVLGTVEDMVILGMVVATAVDMDVGMVAGMGVRVEDMAVDTEVDTVVVGVTVEDMVVVVGTKKQLNGT